MVTWPSLLKPTRPVIRFTLQNASRTGGVALNGQEQVISSGAERWRATGAFRLRGVTAALQFEDFVTQMLGRSGTVNVPTFSGRFANWPVENGVVLSPWVTRDRMLDGTDFQEPEVPSESNIIAELVSPMAIGDVTCDITISQGTAAKVGQLFTISNRLYRIIAATSPIGGAQTLTFRPKARAAHEPQAVRFARPICIMRFATDDEGLGFDGWDGVVTLNFVESF